MIEGPARDRLTRTFQERIAVVGSRAARIAAARWAALGSYDESDVPRFTAETAPAMTAAKAAAVALGVGYYSTLAQVRAPAVNPRDVDIAPNPREPFIAYWRALNHGQPYESALESGAARAEAEARNLATSSARRAGDVTMRRANQRVDGWARDTDANPCPWCRGLTQYVWETATQADFGHARCNCSVSPVIRAGTVSAP